MASKQLLFAGVFAVLGMAGASQAATITVRPVVVTVHDRVTSTAGFNTPTDPANIISQGPDFLLLAPNATGYTAKVDVLINISNLQAGEVGFGNVEFAIGLTGVTRNTVRPNWRIDLTCSDSGVDVICKWADDHDLGIPNDLKHIVVGIAPKLLGDPSVDPRHTLGIAPYNNPPGTNYDGEYAGSVYVDIPPAAVSAGSVNIYANAGSYFDANLDLVAGAALVAGTFRFVPEPSTLALLGFGSAALVFARRRGMPSKQHLFAGVVASLAMAGASQAATITVRPVVVTVHDRVTATAGFNAPTDPANLISGGPGFLVLAPSATGYTAKVDVLINVSNLQAGEVGFGNVAFNIDLAGVTRNALRPNWRPDSSILEVDGESVPKWADWDHGVPNDLRHLVVGIAPKNLADPSVDPRYTLGMAPYNNPPGTNYDGEFAGSVYVDIPADANGAASVSISALAGSYFDANLDLVLGGNFIGEALNIRVVPEPSAFALLVLGSTLLAFARMPHWVGATK